MPPSLVSQRREQWVKPVLLRQVRTGEGTKDTRQRQRKSDLLEMGKDAVEREAIESVIQSLVDGRLLVSDRIDSQDVIDLSHEALMRSWKRLVTWREGDREVRRIVQRIRDAHINWKVKDKNSDYLIQRGLTSEIIEQRSQLKAFLTVDEQDFCQLSVKEFNDYNWSIKMLERIIESETKEEDVKKKKD
jgi:hypothetical protein